MYKIGTTLYSKIVPRIQGKLIAFHEDDNEYAYLRVYSSHLGPGQILVNLKNWSDTPIIQKRKAGRP